MNRLGRYISQVLLWLGVWSTLWVSAGRDGIFIKENVLAFLLQVVILYVLIYYAIPRLLFKKKYQYFVFVTIAIVIVCAYLSSEFAPAPLRKPPPLEPHGGAPGTLPSRFFIHLLVLTISSVTAILLETFIYAQEKEKSYAYAQAELKEAELKFLKMQINPHFLFNALNNIYALSVTNSDKTQEGISTLSQMLRYVLYDCERPEVSLGKEVEYIEHYIALFKLKSSKEFNIRFEQDITNENIRVAPMLFVPFIENAFKHSGIELGGSNYVFISLKAKENHIDFYIENSMPSKPLITDGAGGIGLQNVEKRLEILYPQKHDLTIKKSDTFRVALKVNLK